MIASYLRHYPPERADESRFAKRPPALARARSPAFSGQLDEAGIRERFDQVARVYISLQVAFARESEHGVRAAFDAARYHPREMNAEERELRIRRRVDEAAT